LAKKYLPLVLILLALAAGVIGAVRYFAYWPLYGFEGPLPPATAEEQDLAGRLRGHVVAVASTPHNTAHPQALETAARYIEGQLKALGYEVERQEFDAAGQRVRNIHVSLGGGGADVPSFVVGAHYDSAGIAPGANDNGSGTAAVIELARMLRDFRPKKHRLRLVLFVNEERPHFGTDTMGSLQFARMLVAKEKVAGMISIETIGSYYDKPGTQEFPVPLNLVYRDTGNFITFVGMPLGRSLVHEALGSFRRNAEFPSIGGVAHSFIRGIALSDHSSFHAYGVPAIMITDTAFFRYPFYHLPTDTPDKLDYDRMARVVEGIGRMLRDIVD
jgi:hypothetical protein